MPASAHITEQVITAPHPVADVGVVSKAALPPEPDQLGLALRLADRLLSKVETGKAGLANIVLLALVAGLVGGGGAVALHRSGGDGGVSKSINRLDNELQTVREDFRAEREDRRSQMKVMHYNIRAIAKKVGADLLEE